MNFLEERKIIMMFFVFEKKKGSEKAVLLF